jgi:hypothetical protein
MPSDLDSVDDVTNDGCIAVQQQAHLSVHWRMSGVANTRYCFGMLFGW